MSQYKNMKESFLKLDTLLVYRNILSDYLVKNIQKLIIDRDNDYQENREKKYYNICSKLIKIAERKNYRGDLLENYLIQLIRDDFNPFSSACEKGKDKRDNSIYQAALNDIKIIKEITKFKLTDIGKAIGLSGDINFISDYSPIIYKNKKIFKKQKRFDNLKKAFSLQSSDKIISILINEYKEHGAGILNNYHVFRWDLEKGLMGIENPDSVTFDDLIGYDRQKKKLINNTKSFLKGKGGNNVLLFGDSGTGKSSSVKALVNKYQKCGMRLVEISKNDLQQLPKILRTLKNRGLYFIIFMDDFSFENFETDYKYLKAVMEGGVEDRPGNVLFYATSNRRHLIEEKWEDRLDKNGEIHKNDALQEKLSLAERFGITINYMNPDQKEYLNIVEGLVQKRNIKIKKEELKEKAKKWVMWNNSRSGRSAQQFINHLLTEEKLQK